MHATLLQQPLAALFLWQPFSGAVARHRLAIGLVCAAALVAFSTECAGDESHQYFETHVRPLLATHCYECHGAEKQSAGLRLDRRASLLAGGDSGPAIVPGKADSSLMIEVVRRQGDIQMPPDDPLSADQIAVLSTWITAGAPWPDDAGPVMTSVEERARDHWAFQPVRDPDVPQFAPTDAHAAWIRNSVDAFILAKLQAAGLGPAREADRATLIRRAYYSVLGLPPTHDQVMAFVSDAEPDAYERLIERLLESPHYGEQWARHWLDVARYADTKGYVYAREERFWIHAWVYRDWVVRALNKDLPYDRFLLLQIAADQVEDRQPEDLAAMGYLTLGRRFLGVKHDVIDDRIDVVCRGTMGLTVACARCHDHKYDPIPTADYYSLYGVFDSSLERAASIGDAAALDEAFRQGLAERQQKLDDTTAKYRRESADDARKHVTDYLLAQLELDKYPAEGFDQILQPNDIYPAYVRQWEADLRQRARNADPVFSIWHALMAIDSVNFAEQASARLAEMRQRPAEQVNPLVAALFEQPPTSMTEVAQRYGKLLSQIDGRWQGLLAQAATEGKATPTSFADPAEESLRQLLYGPQAPCEVPEGTIVVTETFFPTSHCEELWRLQGDVDRWIIAAGERAPHVVALFDSDHAKVPRIFRRGNAVQKGDDVPRQFLKLLSGTDRQSFQQGSGRLELAKAIIDRTNPLTARVMVNRMWRHHFGSGLVATPSDFGTRAAAPSHPELLDWLASRLMDENWSLKAVHRHLLLSATFRQATEGSVDEPMRQAALGIDPDNRLLWHANRRRLTFEEMRDTLLSATGDLEPGLGGKPAEMLQAPFPHRRALYGLVDRQFLPGTLRTFDFANPDLHTPQRSETTVPQQALFFLNHPFMLEQTRRLAEITAGEADLEQRITAMFRRVLLRSPSDTEMTEAQQWLADTEIAELAVVPPTVDDWSYGFGVCDEATGRTTHFTPLPHFSANAWQGGPNYPDPTLGWVQLTAQGGHPGNDRHHAAVRRWTAKNDMTIRIQSTVTHEEKPGDGIRAFVISSRTGILATANVHQQSIPLNVESVAVAAGDTIDFLVDIGDVLHSDQYLWPVTLCRSEVTTTDAAPMSDCWSSVNDFTRDSPPRLSRWEQFAQVLLCTNEFVFVD